MTLNGKDNDDKPGFLRTVKSFIDEIGVEFGLDKYVKVTLSM